MEFIGGHGLGGKNFEGSTFLEERSKRGMRGQASLWGKFWDKGGGEGFG